MKNSFFLTHCILVDSSTVIMLGDESDYHFMGVGSIFHFHSIFDAKSC